MAIEIGLRLSEVSVLHSLIAVRLRLESLAIMSGGPSNPPQDHNVTSACCLEIKVSYAMANL